MAEKRDKVPEGIGGGKKVIKDFNFTKYIGFFRGSVVAINPSRKELNKLLGKEGNPKDEEIEYTGEKDGVKTIDLDFWMDVEGKEGTYIKHNIQLKNETQRNKDGDKIQVVNQVGDSQWPEADNKDVFSEEDLWESFKNFTKVISWQLPNGDVSEKYEAGSKAYETEILAPKRFRKSMSGEGRLLEFMQGWLFGMDLNDFEQNPNMFISMKELFAGRVNSLSSQIGGDYDKNFTALAYIDVSTTDPDIHYQKVYNKLLPAGMIRFINNDLKFDKYNITAWNKWLKKVQDTDHGIKGYYVLEPLKEYKPDEDIATSTETKKSNPTPTNSEY